MVNLTLLICLENLGTYFPRFILLHLTLPAFYIARNNGLNANALDRR